jgi:hypothetical protein
LDGTIVTEFPKTERPTATESFETTLMKLLKSDDSTTVARLEETIENQIKTYIEREDLKLEDLLRQAGVAATEQQLLEDIGGLDILLTIYSARGMDFGIYNLFLFITYLFQPGMTFFISNVKEMGISHVVAMKLYQRLKLWRAEAEIKIVVVEDLSTTAASAAATVNTTEDNNDNIAAAIDGTIINTAIVGNAAAFQRSLYKGWKNQINLEAPMTVDSNVTTSISSSSAITTASSGISPYAIGLQTEG